MERRQKKHEGDKAVKRKMKTAGQLELLEKTYLRENYPSEALRGELSEKLGLTDRQLQMWFCHRRLKDRKAPPKKSKKDGGSDSRDAGSSGGVGVDANTAASQEDWSLMIPVEPTRKNSSGRANAIARIAEGSGGTVRRYFDPTAALQDIPPPPLMHHPHVQPSLMELRVTSIIEAQLGEPLREDGPLLGVEFDPLPPDAFGAPIMSPHSIGPPKQVGWQYESKTYERQDMKALKASSLSPGLEQSFLPTSPSIKRKPAVGSAQVLLPHPGTRALHEYQFLPQQPSTKSETFDRTGPSELYEPSVEPLGGRASVPAGAAFSHGNEQLNSSYPFQGPVTTASHLSQQGKHNHMLSANSADYAGLPVKSSLTNYETHTLLGDQTVLRLENSFASTEKPVYHEEDSARLDRKRKAEEARIAREVEAHEKRIRKELERQDILKRKREEQLKREMERQERERKKEEERLMRERQREEERFQREQKRELERREKFLQKENQRAEKMRHKEQLRQEKEVARLKAANERATARKLARESMELIEDERLELMELAASNKGLPSIVSLDSETLQNLELLRDGLCSFPPKSVQLKAPFRIQPWLGSDENIGNLLMVWRFLITFLDVLELWPFTLDEFVQSLHDYDPRLLGEVHIALLRTIIKDIEDVARTPATVGANQNYAANPSGGHPQVVEGAYAWGFDIRNWQKHLNPLTWPEVLRQFALSAGFGPKWRKRSPRQTYIRDDNEGRACMDVVSNLRTGAAAENAAAVMQEKGGFSYLRRSRHRLTPGTVKFAAFHVLSLEGDRGLTILQVADRIQKSGLRDLTTSRTPEASIAAALSRDAHLFERTAPSTYCVRPPFRKDPANAEAILQVARERIQAFQNADSDSDTEKDADDNDEVERDEDFECDADDPEGDGVTMSNIGMTFSSSEGRPQASGRFGDKKGEGEDAGNQGPAGNTKDAASCNLEITSNGVSVEDFDQIHGRNGSNHQLVSSSNHDDTEIDESAICEQWVQGLTEGEYSDLSVEERLTAFVALISVALEGNTIRVVLEERLEASNDLKKQMWSEAQIDKRRMKEESMSKLQYTSFMGVKTEGTPQNNILEEGQSPLTADNKVNDVSTSLLVKQEEYLVPKDGHNYLHATVAERNLLVQESPVDPEQSPLQPYACIAEKSRSQLKAYIGQQAEELYIYRSLPLGQDRRRNRYWRFATSSKNDPGCGRIFFESRDGFWRVIDTEEDFDALLAALDTRGIREAHLHSMLLKTERSFREALKKRLSLSGSLNFNGHSTFTETAEAVADENVVVDSPSSTICNSASSSLELSKSFKIDVGGNNSEKIDALERYKDLQKWLWTECFQQSVICAMKYGKRRSSELLSKCNGCYMLRLSEDKHCPCCHKTFESGSWSLSSFVQQHVSECEEKRKTDSSWKPQDSSNTYPIRVQILKALLALIEVHIPAEALKSSYTESYRKLWATKLQESDSSEGLFEILTLLEYALKKDWLSSSYETTKELLGSVWTRKIDDSSFPAVISVLPWVPKTTAAVALRLFEFDASVVYMLHLKEFPDDKEAQNKLVPSRFTVVKSVQDNRYSDAADMENQQEEKWPETIGQSYRRGRSSSSISRGRERGRGSRGGRLRSGISRRRRVNSERSAQGRGRKARTRGRGRGRGSRTLRGKLSVRKKIVKKDASLPVFGGVSNTRANSCSDSDQELSRSPPVKVDWSIGKVENRNRQPVDADNSADMSGSDINEQVSEDEYDDQEGNLDDAYDGSPDAVLEGSDEEDGEGEDGDDYDDGGQGAEGDLEEEDEEEEDDDDNIGDTRDGDDYNDDDVENDDDDEDDDNDDDDGSDDAGDGDNDEGDYGDDYDEDQGLESFPEY